MLPVVLESPGPQSVLRAARIPRFGDRRLSPIETRWITQFEASASVQHSQRGAAGRNPAVRVDSTNPSVAIANTIQSKVYSRTGAWGSERRQPDWLKWQRTVVLILGRSCVHCTSLSALHFLVRSIIAGSGTHFFMNGRTLARIGARGNGTTVCEWP